MLVVYAQPGSTINILHAGGNVSQEQVAALVAAFGDASAALDTEGGELATKAQALVDELNKPNPDIASVTDGLVAMKERVSKLSDLIPEVAPAAGTTETGGTTEG